MRFRHTLLITLFLLTANEVSAQRFLTDMMDTTTAIGKGIYPLYGKHDKLRFGGYMQPQYQWIEENGAKTYAGGDFSAKSNNRFMLRRGRIRIDYMHLNEKNQPLAFFAFQFDGTERGVAIRDFWGRFYENKLQCFAVTAGMFARPMGYEVNLSSSDRESPERGRMSQILMKTERDIGAMITFEPRQANSALKWLKVDLSAYNGQGLNGPTDYDNHKDVVGRITVKPQKLGKTNMTIGGSTSIFYGGITSQSPWLYSTDGTGTNAMIKGDSADGNIGHVTPRHYYGADVQFRIPNKKGFSEFRAEYIAGQQTSTATTSETPGTYPFTATNTPQPLYTRGFNGAYFYYLQHLGTNKLQLVLKYDWYDPNVKVKGDEITAAKGFTAADVKYSTLGSGLVYYMNVHVKLFLYYDWVTNEKTGLNNYTSDLKDNVLTCRVQYRF